MELRNLSLGLKDLRDTAAQETEAPERSEESSVCVHPLV